MAFPFLSNNRPTGTTLSRAMRALPKAPSRPMRKMLFEPLEPRVLLNGEGAFPGVVGTVDAGFQALYEEIEQMLGDELFDVYVPGFLTQIVKGDGPELVSPTLAEALTINDIVGDETGGLFDLADRFRFLDSIGDGFWYEDVQKLRVAWDVFDVNDDGSVSVAEAFGVLVLGQIQDFIETSNLFDLIQDPEVEDFAAVLKTFINPLNPLDDFAPDAFGWLFDIDISADYEFTANGDLQFSLDVTLTYSQMEQLDLGYQADEIGITLNPGEPPQPGEPFELSVKRTLAFDTLIFGFAGAAESGQTSELDFYVAVPDGMRIGVEMNGKANGMELNIGFLGAEVINDANYTGYALDMFVDGFALDPSNPSPLGFESYPVVASDGTITAPNETAVFLQQDVQFSLKVGLDGNSTFGEITIPGQQFLVEDNPNTFENETLNAFVALVQDRVDAELPMGLVTVSEVDGKLQFSIPESDPTVAGFANEAVALGTLVAANEPLGTTAASSGSPFSVQGYSFLLRVGSEIRLVTVDGFDAVNIGTEQDPEWVVTPQMYQAALQAALDNDDAFGAGFLTVTVSGGKLQIEKAGAELEITGTLTLDYVNKITIAELESADVFQVMPDAGSSFEVGLKVRAIEGLEYTGSDDAYRPEGTIAVAKLNPFNQGALADGADIEPVTISVVPQTGEPVVKVRYDLVLGESGEVDGEGEPVDRMLEMLDFNVLGTSEILGILNQVGVWLDRAVGTQLFTAFDLPFAGASLADILFFGDMVRDQFLVDDGDDGLTRPDADGVKDKERLLRWSLVKGEWQLVPMFTNAQQLEARLAEIGVILFGEFLAKNSLPALSNDQKDDLRDDLKEAIDASYDPDTLELTYNLDTDHFLGITTASLVPQAQQDKGIPVPLDFDLDLEPLGALVTDGEVLLNGDGQFTFTLGIKLGDAASPLSFGDPLNDDFGASLLLEDLNNGRGVALNTNLALTSLVEIDPIVGRLTSDAVFTVALKVDGEWLEPVQVKILRNEQPDEDHPDFERPFTSDNLTFANLVDDLNDALVKAGLAGKVVAVDAYAGTGERDSGRIVLVAVDGDVEAFQVSASSGNSASTQLGLPPQSAATTWLLAPRAMQGPVPLNDPNDPNSSVLNISFEIKVQRAGQATADTAQLVTVLANPIEGNDSWTSNNTTLSDLVNDVNAALRAAGLGSDIVAGRSGNSIAFFAISNDVQGFTILPGSSAGWLGLSEDAARDRLQNWGVDTSGSEFDDPITAGVVLRAQDVASNPFGRLAIDEVTFSLVLTPATGAAQTVNVTLEKSDTATNSSILDLVRDLNEELQKGDLDGRVVAWLDGSNIIFRALDPSIAGLKITGLSDAESAQLGFQDDAEVKADLKVIANRVAPVSFGITGDTTFVVNVESGLGDLSWEATLTEAVTLANRSLFDLAADINQAMNQGFIAAYWTPGSSVTVNDNPLVAVVQGDRIVIGLKTEAGSGTLAGTLTPASAAVTGFSIEAEGDSKAATELGLVPTGANLQSQGANLDDFIVQFSNGTQKGISLDDLAGPDGLLSNDKNLADLRQAILDQAGAKLSVELRADGSGLVLKENGWVSDGAEFRVIAVNGSPAALQLGILAADTTQLDVGQFDAAEAGKPDGVIIGASIATLDILDRVFLQDPVLSANISVKTDGVVSAEANFGFVGVRLESNNNQPLYAASIDVPFFTVDDRVDLNALFSNLGQPSNLWQYIDLPEVTLTAPGSFAFKMSVIPDDSLGDLFQGVPANATVQFSLPATLGALEKYYAGTEILPENVTPADFDAVRLVPASVGVAPMNAGPLADFADLAMANVIDALDQVSQFLKTFADFDFLGETLPLLGVSINELLDVSGRFDQALETIKLNPAGGLQALAQSLRQGFNLPDFANDDERNDWFAARGIPDPGALIGFALTTLPNPGPGLRIDLRLPVAFNESRAIDLDLGEVLGEDFGPLSLLGGAGLGVSGYLDTRLSFGIGLEADPDVYLFDEVSGIEGALQARADNLAFNAAIGPLGVFVRDGQVLVDLGFGFGQELAGAPDANAAQSLDDLIGNGFAGFKPIFSGDITAALPLFFPSDSVYLDDITLSYTGLSLDPVSFAIDPGVFDLDIPDLGDIDFDEINPFGSIPLMLDAFDLVLQTLQDLLDGEVFGLQLPLVGDQLSSGADFIDKLRRDVLSPIRQFVEQAPEMGLEIMQALLYSLLGPGSQGVSITVAGSSILLKDFLGLTNDYDGLGLLADYETGSTEASQVSILDVVPWKSPGDDDFSWRFRLGQEYTPSVAIGFDLGFPGLGLALDAGLDVTINWDLALGLGISPTDGAYLLVGDHGGDMGDVEFKAGIEVRLPDGSSLDGRLGFLQIIATSNDTYFNADFELDITNGGDADAERLSFFQFGALDAEVTLSAEAEVDLEFVAQFNRALLPDTIAALLPSLQADFLLSWSTGEQAILAGEFDFAGHLEKLGFENVSLDMGSFLGEFLGPVVNKIAEITSPLQPVIDVFTAPIPLVSDLAGRPVTLLDIAGLFGKVDTGMIYALADIITLVNQIGGISSNDKLLVPLGTFTLFDKNNENGNLNDGGFAQALSLPTFDFATWGGEGGENFKNFIEDTGQLIDDFAGKLAQGVGSDKTKNLSQGLLTGTAPGAGQFSFPLFDNPWLAFGLLIGQDIPLVEYDLPPFGVDFTYVQQFPIWGPLFARLSGSIGLTIDLAFGYDTRGVRDFAEGNFSNPLDLLAGFYVNDTDQPGGTGTDVPELILRGEIFAGAEINLGIASAGVEGGIILTINFDLYDPDRDGKVRINELVGNFLYEFRYGNPAKAPLAIFDVFGDIALQLRAFIEILFFEASFEITPPITLVEFSIEFDREPILATERGDGSLLLNVGPNAGARLNSDTRDIGEEIYVRSLSASEVEVWAPGLGVPESAAQSYKIGADKLIVAYGGDGNDLIDLSGVTHNIRYFVDAGPGDDTVLGTQAGGEMYGGLGNDVLVGGAGDDFIVGGFGNDYVFGAGGQNVLIGDNGRRTSFELALQNNTTVDMLRFNAPGSIDDGDDVIIGGNDADIIIGGGGYDLVFGGGGNDLVLGDGGYFEGRASDRGIPIANGVVDIRLISTRGAGAPDRIYGGAGNDTILGGAGNDFIEGGSGRDLVSGGAGNDVIYGGEGSDWLFGDEGDDILFGGRDPFDLTGFGANPAAAPALAPLLVKFSKGGPDVITAITAAVTDGTNDLADWGHPDAGDDYIEGGDGNDFIRGQGGNDTLHGNRGNDIIFGDQGIDTIGAGFMSRPWLSAAKQPYNSESGADIIFGGADGDIIDGGSGADIVFGDDGLVVYLGFAPTGNVDGLRAANERGSLIRSNGADRFIGDGDESQLVPVGYSHDGLWSTPDLYATMALASDGDDTISGGDGNDIIFGGGGNDTVYGDFDPTPSPEPAFFGPRPTGQDVIIGDGGRVELSQRRFAAIQTLSSIANDGDDIISGNDGSDYIFGGGGEDTIYGFHADLGTYDALVDGVPDNDVIFGDNGRIEFNPAERANRITTMYTLYDGDGVDSGASDTVFGQFGNDVIFGGLNSAAMEELSGGLGDDIIIGDQGEIVFETDAANFDALAWTESYPLLYIRSFDDNRGGVDHIYGEQGSDILVGGTAGDFMYGDDATGKHGAADGGDIMLGDNGRIEFSDNPGKLKAMIAAMLKGAAVDRIFTTDGAEDTGGADFMFGNAGADIMFGGVNDGGVDRMWGDRENPSQSSLLLDGDDVLVGDNGIVDFAFGGDTDRTTLDLIRSYPDNWGGTDYIYGQSGGDVALGGTGGDFIFGDDEETSAAALDGDDVLLGDNGDILLVAIPAGASGDLRLVLGTAIIRIATTDTTENTGGADVISGNAGSDIIVGGVNAGGVDYLYGDREAPDQASLDRDGDDLFLGDNGRIQFAFLDGDRMIVQRIESFEDGLGGTDFIAGHARGDLAIGGTGSDFIFGDSDAPTAISSQRDGDDILVGDNAFIELDAAPAVAPADRGDLRTVFTSAVYVIRTTDDDHLNNPYGGVDVVAGNAGNDIVIGGVEGDYLYGDTVDADLNNPLDLMAVIGSLVAVRSNYDGANIMLGDNGLLEWRSSGRLGDISGIDVGFENPDLAANFGDGADSDLTTLDLITTEQPTNGGNDWMWGGDGNDAMFGGTGSDTMFGDNGITGFGGTGDPENTGVPPTGTTDGADLMFGDHGRLYPQFSVLRPTGEPWQDYLHSRNFFAIHTGQLQGGAGDRMWGQGGDDIMLGQQGDDLMWGGDADDDMIGGHNVRGGWDELGDVSIKVTMSGEDQNEAPVTYQFNDIMDGGAGDDVMAGDNAIIWRRGLEDAFDPRFRELEAGKTAMYDVSVEGVITTNVAGQGAENPTGAAGRDITLVDHSFAIQANPQGTWGRDIMAGGAEEDRMFGQLGDDLMQGDGEIVPDADDYFEGWFLQFDLSAVGFPDGDYSALVFYIPERGSDGNDYMEGNGGADVMFGGLGQDDMIGGSSSLFGLDAEDSVEAAELRPDGADIMFGGAGKRTDRNDAGVGIAFENELYSFAFAEIEDNGAISMLAGGHARDADFMMGDNANIYRLVSGEGEFLEYNYDNYAGDERIIPRAMEQLDYTLGGADYRGGEYIDGAAVVPGQPGDNGAADFLHGEAGDDIMFGMTGSDIMFGGAGDDDLIGGYGHDWMSGGTGRDGMLGDDGLILTSRNSVAGEPLYGVEGLSDRDTRPKYSDGNVLDEIIYTPGNIQYSIINKTGELKKAAVLTPFSYELHWSGMDDDFVDRVNKPFADDIMFGGLGSDWLHGGSGDDAMSGAEALENAYIATFVDGQPSSTFNLGYDAVGLPSSGPWYFLLADKVHGNQNRGDALRFNPVDEDGWQTQNRQRAGEFYYYDEYDPLRKIMLRATGELDKSGHGLEFLLNFEPTEGVLREGREAPAKKNEGVGYPAVNDDGGDVIFGDNGNDWLVGGTGRDRMYGGWGNDLLNADDDHATNGSLNDQPDTHPYYEDIAYGGAGRDVLIANTGGDRLIDWVGEYNSYLVPFAPFGMATVSRTLQPFLPEYLYALALGDGIDDTRAEKSGGDPLRNGEPFGELGLVLQKDFAWQAQTGAPADPQAGNIPGGKRDVLRTADFSGLNTSEAQGFMIDSGKWAVAKGRYVVEPTKLGESALAVWHHDAYQPNYFEVTATINVIKPTAGFKANGYIVFDYQDADNFKFAGLNQSTNKVEIGQKTDGNWTVLTSINLQIRHGVEYNLLLSVNGNAVILQVNNQHQVAYTFAPRVDADGILYNINSGMIGLGADNSKTSIANFRLLVLPPQITHSAMDDFSTQPALIQGLMGEWALQDGKMVGQPTPGLQLSMASGELTIGPAHVLQLQTRVATAATAGIVFDQYATDDFKWAAWDKTTNQVQIGHYTAKSGWVVDKSVSMNLSGDVDLSVTLKGTTVSVLVNDSPAVSHVFNSIVTDGAFGLLAKGGTASFDHFGLLTDDPRFAAPASSNITAAFAGSGVDVSPLDARSLDAIAQAAMNRWAFILGEMPAVFYGLEFTVADLGGLALARIEGNTITVDDDAAGHGWFIDSTPYDDGEFRVRTADGLRANTSSEAFGKIDLLTVLMHELGHAIGYQHDVSVPGAAGLMAEALEPGLRAVDFAPPGQAQRVAQPGDSGAWTWDAQRGAFMRDAAQGHGTRLFSYLGLPGSVEATDDWFARESLSSAESLETDTDWLDYASGAGGDAGEKTLIEWVLP